MKKDLRYVTFKIENSKQIVVDAEGAVDKTWEDFKGALPDTEPRYALVEFEYKTGDGREQSKLVFVFWSPDDGCTVKQKMLYASSKDAIKKKLTGVMKERQANDKEDLKQEDVA